MSDICVVAVVVSGHFAVAGIFVVSTSQAESKGSRLYKSACGTNVFLPIGDIVRNAARVRKKCLKNDISEVVSGTSTNDRIHTCCIPQVVQVVG